MAQNETGGANRRFWSMFPLTRVPFWYRFLSLSQEFFFFFSAARQPRSLTLWDLDSREAIHRSLAAIWVWLEIQELG